MANLPTNVAKSLGQLAGETIYEAAKQSAKVAAEVLEGAVGGGAGQKAASGKQTMDTNIKKLEEATAIKDSAEISRLRQNELPASQSARNVEKEIEEIRKEKKKKEEDQDEKEFLARLAKQREEEKRAIQADAAIMSSDKRPERGSAFAPGMKQKQAEVKAVGE